jgi:hypothetical protein
VTTYDDVGLDALYHRLYMQLKDGTVDPEVAFDLACHVLSVYPFAEDAAERDGAAVWWCAGAGGHVAAPIGQWPA